MYKEVNGSLIKWPAAASVAMLAISWFLMDPDADQATNADPGDLAWMRVSSITPTENRHGRDEDQVWERWREPKIQETTTIDKQRIAKRIHER